MFRALAVLLLLAYPASAQVTVPDFGGDAIPSDALSCEATGANVGCAIALDARIGFCMAVDAEGRPVANSTSVSATGVVMFQNVDAAQIAELRCRPI